MRNVFRILMCLPLVLPLAAFGGVRTLIQTGAQRPVESEEHNNSGGEVVSEVASHCRRSNDIATAYCPGPLVLRLQTARRLGFGRDYNGCFGGSYGHCLGNGLRAPLLT